MTRHDARSRLLLTVATAFLAVGGALRTLPSAGYVHMMTAEAPTARPATVLRPVSCQKLPDSPGKSVTTVLVDFPPLAASPPHRHPGTVTAYVLKGTLRSQLAGEPMQTFRPGQTWFEPPGALHLVSENPSPAESAELLAVFIADTDCGALVIPEPPS